ncbi:putative trans-sialidase [Trypanosoma cruzi]|uniref:Trans-sialidase, putative n=2 Tax=Trypanosoma cruzi TaxID=5693 RepID=Q4DR51_TRYCC|nr:trans-sialidase, putative [Trypanosoma cruzi]EAN95002.1 trans-sialidase, putative [Trypanosoma cruzi]PWV05337.1 putative trans-sialidase [Trypanosoma cruzi]RNC35335.1 sialidase-like protein [Trypanosoma cruzi]|eukprot:XP_816853.1 trans-sialidase [Trypanosoma cruzi strain CL Brener]
MLSRVAAVKAPRTHNRCRVTGSRGRRREGRESEPQRPNMSRRVFASAVLLLLVVMVWCGCGGAHAVENNSSIAINPFTGTTRIDATWKDVEINTKSASLHGPTLVEVQGHVFAIAEVHCKDGGDCSDVSFTGIASKYLGLNVVADSTEISTADASIFGADLLKEGYEGISATNGITRPTTLVIEDSVYMLLGKQSHTKKQVERTNEGGLFLVKGTVSDEGEKKKIRWNETHLVNPQGKAASLSLTELIGGGGSGAVMRDGTLVFPMQAKGKDGESVLLSIRLPKQRNKWELSSETPGKGCRDPTLVKWKEDQYGERLFMMAHCAGGYYDVYMSTLHGVSWYTLGESINRVWGNSHGRTGYGVQSGSTTAIIEGKEVMLITAPVYEKENGEGRLHLWVTDKARVYDVGPVSREDDDAAASSLLIKDNNNELISLYENKKSDGSYNLVAVRLTEKLERIKEVVKTWKDLDSALKTCRSGSSGTVDALRKDMCNGPVPTNRLVGFLSGNFSENTWRDEYLGVNAKVKNGKRRVPNGLTFKGSWAEWPVGDMGQTVPYYFANNKFTLVATVSIHEVPKEDSSPVPLIGVRMNDTSSTVLFGLSYTHDKKWLAIPGNRAASKRVDDIAKWEPNKTYQVVLQMDSDFWTVVVDGKEMRHMKYNTSLFNSHRISHFYIGGDSKHQIATGGHVTVTNVMLYNEELSEDDVLDELHASKVTIPSLGVEEQPTGQVANTDALVASESNSEESATSHDELNESDTDEQGDNSVDDPVPAASSSTVVAGSSVPEPAIATESADNSRSDDNAQLSEEETSWQDTPNEENKSMQRGSDLQPQDPQSTKLTEVTDVEMSSGSYDEELPEEDGEADDRSGKSTSPVTASLSMETAAGPVYGEHQVQKSIELSAENNDVRPTGTGTTGAEESLSLEAGDRNSERAMNSDSSLTPSGIDAEPRSAEDTDNISWTERAEFSSGEGKEVPQTVDTAPANTNTTPGGEGIPSTKGAARHSDNDTFTGEIAELLSMGLNRDSTVHVCVSRVLLLLLLGLWSIAALC